MIGSVRDVYPPAACSGCGAIDFDDCALDCETPRRYVVVDIGCLECGEKSELLAVDVTARQALAGPYPNGPLTGFREAIARWGGQGMIVAFRIPTSGEADRV